jgi:hypothetical protein
MPELSVSRCNGGCRAVHTGKARMMCAITVQGKCNR